MTTPGDMGRLGRIGGLASSAKLTPEQLSARGTLGNKVRWDRERARREAAGLPPLGQTERALDDAEYDFWLNEVDLRFPDRVYTNRMQRRRLAERLARESAARIIESALRSAGQGPRL